jgi:cell pole-organizing protein PopZ
MSVALSSNDDADAEALRRAQRAHEPSMDEILASIRAIIADDREPAAPKPQIVYSSDAPVKPVAPESEPAPTPPTVVWTRKAEAPESAAQAPQSPPAQPQEEPLMSEEAEDAVSESFAALSESLSEHAMQVAGDMAREMLRPMLKAWLDENLPPLVEKLVRAEIQRLARGRR